MLVVNFYIIVSMTHKAATKTTMTRDEIATTTLITHSTYTQTGNDNTTNTNNETKRNETKKKNDWSTYRLGDWVLGKGRTSMNGFNDSLAWEYMIELDKKSNGTGVVKGTDDILIKPLRYRRDVFCECVKKRGLKRFRNDMLPQNGDLIIHLRLGDVLSDDVVHYDEIDDAFEYGVSIVPSQIRNMIHGNGTLGWWHYLKSKCYYENMLSELDATIAAANTNKKHFCAKIKNAKRVIIVGSTVHQNNGAHDENSIKYAQLVSQFFSVRGYEVTTHLDDGSPDNDMVWMSHAPIFVAAGGGFSKLASDCVDYFGGASFTKSDGWSNGLDESCSDLPRPDIPMKNYTWEAKEQKWRGKSYWNGVKSFPPEPTIWG